jgi:hypothetical protein
MCAPLAKNRKKQRGYGAHARSKDDTVLAAFQGHESFFQMPGRNAVFPGVLELVQMVPGQRGQ